MTYFRKICPISLLFLAHAALGAGADRITPGHSEDTWDRAAGFPGGHVYSITQTSDGYLWIGTSKGLVKYDGLSFVSVPEVDSSPAAKFAVVGLVTDSSDQLWATDDRTHLFRYSGGHLVGPLADSGKRLHRAGAVSKTYDGWLLFASDTQGLVEYERERARVLLDPSAIPSSPTAVAQGEDGSFWIGTRDKGVVHFNAETGRSRSSAHYKPARHENQLPSSNCGFNTITRH